MALMAVTCSLDGQSLRLEREVFDAIDRVYVGRLVCPKCGAVYLDQRKAAQRRPEQLVVAPEPEGLHGLALCAGVGGLELGVGLAVPGYRTVAYVEREAYGAAALVARMADGALDPAPVWDDVTTFDGRRWRGRVDVVCAGFPCQPWSAAGKGEGVDDERWIWPALMDRIREVDPWLVFLENVPPLVSRGGLALVLGDLADGGFDAEWGVLRAADVGASHQRERVYILAYRDGGRLAQLGAGDDDNGGDAWRAGADRHDAGVADAGDDRRAGDARGGRQTLDGAEHTGRAVVDADGGGQPRGGLADVWADADEGHAELGDPGRTEWRRRAQPASLAGAGASADDRGAGGALADADGVGSGASWSHRRQARPAGASGGAGAAGVALADAGGTGRQRRQRRGAPRGRHRAEAPRPAAELRGASLGDAADGGRGELREPSRGAGQPDGADPPLARWCREFSVCYDPNVCDGHTCALARAGRECPVGWRWDDDVGEFVADAARDREHRPLREDGGRGRGIRQAGDELADADGGTLRVQPERDQREGGRARAAEREHAESGAALPLFPPPPADAAGWRGVLAGRPDLAPALAAALGDAAQLEQHQEREGAAAAGGRGPELDAGLGAAGGGERGDTGQAEAEPGVRRVADGPAERVDRLRACGNSVVPLAAAYAFRALCARACR